MRVVDTVVLDALRDTGITIHEGLVEVETTPEGQPNVLLYDVPYCVYASNVGDVDNPRLTGRPRRRSVYFRLFYVGDDQWQTKATGEALQAAIAGKRFDIPGVKSWPVQLLTSQQVRRDDDMIRPDGSPVFYGVDDYDLALNSTDILIPA